MPDSTPPPFYFPPDHTWHNVPVPQIALAWLLHKDGVTSVIIGACKEEQLVDNLKSVDVELSAEELARLDKVSQLAPEYPHWIPPICSAAKICLAGLPITVRQQAY